MIIFTQLNGKERGINIEKGNFPQTRIVAVENSKSMEKVLTADFYSARSPEISFDGKFMLFTAQKKQNDQWQIWEINLENLKTRQVISSKENCIDPAYLPGGRFVFTRISSTDTLNTGHSLFTCNLTGSDIRQITFNPHSWSGSVVLNDGRILTLSQALFPIKKEPEFKVLRPDGTKADLFYQAPDGNLLSGRGRETTNGKIVFIESDKNNHELGSVISISYNRPLHTRVNLTSAISGSFKNVFPLPSGKLLVSYRKSEDDRYALFEFDPERRVLGQAIYDNKDFDVLEAVEVVKHVRPKKLPSEVDMGVKSGLLMCQDINVFDIHPTGKLKASIIKVIGKDSTLGIVQVAEDGSFYLKVIADTPFKIQTIDGKGNVLDGPCDWIWLRPNERRGCVGCHEDPEMVPENKVPVAVRKSPVIIPMHITKVVEKKVSLE